MSKDKSDKNWFGRHKILTVIGAIIVIAIIASAAGGSKSSTGSGSSKSSSSASKKPAATTAKIGQPADDGKFQFTVNSIKCGETSLSDSLGNVESTAQGQFCRLNVTVKNIANQPQSLDETAQYLYSAQGAKYSTDTDADIWAQPSDQDPWDNDINPGNSLTSDIMFDVPKNVTPVTAELHDSSLSGGVKVSLQ